MPTPSDTAAPKLWEARQVSQPRSVFGNFVRRDERPLPAAPRDDASSADAAAAGAPVGPDEAIARAFLLQFLSCGFADPTREAWAWLSRPATLDTARLAALQLQNPGLAEAIGGWGQWMNPEGWESFKDDHGAAFGHGSRGVCPPNEIEYGGVRADGLFQPHRLADLAAFYRAFGLEVGDDAGERHDHISIELEFMAVLAAKEAAALQAGQDGSRAEVCRTAARHFLKEHLGRWSLAFARRLIRECQDGPLRSLAHILLALISEDCRRFGVQPGSEEIDLRPVDDAAERLCESCELRNLPPGAATTGARI